MSNPSTYNLSKPPIFLLKTKSTPHDGYEEYFRDRIDRYEPVFVPVLEHRFHDENLRRVREYFLPERVFLPDSKRRRRYGGIIFTSQRAVEAFTHVLTDDVGGT
jgi:uroporphyrinogen-III synthase